MSETYEQEQERLVRETEAREFDLIESYTALRKQWKNLTKQMQATRAGGVKWLKLNGERNQVLTSYAKAWFLGDERKAIFDLIEGIK